MQGFFSLLGLGAAIALLLYVQQPYAPSAVVEVTSGGFADPTHDSVCEVANLEHLRKSAIVYTWVNGTERCYNKRREHAGLSPGGSSRDKEMGELKYSLRSLLKYAPWLEGPIYIVTPGQIPDWLDLSHPRIKVIDQDDLLPKDKVTLPNFDTNVIEQYLHKIPGLTDVFIHMNDDYLFIKNVGPNRFFTCDGGLRLLTEINHIRHVKGTKGNAWLASVRNTVELTDRVYGGEHVYNFLKHAPFVYSRRAFEKMHEKFGEELDKTGKHQLRHHEDLNVPLLHHIYMQEEGSKELNIPIQFNPLSECDDWLLVRVTDDEHDDLKRRFDNAIKGKGPEVLFALNDEYSNADTARIVNDFYRKLLPDVAPWELPSGTRNTILSNYHGSDCAYDPKILPLPSLLSSSALRTQLEERVPLHRRYSPYQVYFNKGQEVFAPNGPSAAGYLSDNVGYLAGLFAGIVLSVIMFRWSSQDVLEASRSKRI
ncbi:TPA: hypothetical protein N0F65_005241 [Lagenidium giganteum]|uniref:Exopolysaccharide phosphotransferase n=1 Tax=Lagenidium giganteum TaxID=4803 RepID=A0AAV2YXD5_9STRA|nr:TPA: hypothetical protein N0F65_005241 [Lagenidium giganteum]